MVLEASTIHAFLTSLITFDAVLEIILKDS